MFDLVLPFGQLQMVDEAVNLERANWVEECGRINAAYVMLLLSSSYVMLLLLLILFLPLIPPYYCTCNAPADTPRRRSSWMRPR